MSNNQIAEYIAKHGVTKCPPALAKGVKTNRAVKKHIAKERREWRRRNAV